MNNYIKPSVLILIILIASCDMENSNLFLLKSIICFIVLIFISFKYLKDY